MGLDMDAGKSSIPPPLFMKIKKPEQFTDEEVAAAESYEAEVQKAGEKSLLRKRELEAEKRQLQTKIEEHVLEIDGKVKELFWLRINVEKCVLSEELKMLTLNRDLGISASIHGIAVRSRALRRPPQVPRGRPRRPRLRPRPRPCRAACACTTRSTSR